MLYVFVSVVGLAETSYYENEKSGLQENQV